MRLLLDALKKEELARLGVAQQNTTDPDILAHAAGHRLLAAKAATARGNLGIIPLAIISGLLLAAGGSYYVWREISPTQSVHRPDNMAEKQAALAEDRSRSAMPVDPLRRAVAQPARPLRIERHQSSEGVDPTLLAAWHAYRDGDFATAWQIYRTVLQQDGKNRDALLGLAAIARQQGRDDVAAQYYGYVLARDPRDPVAHAGMASLASGDVANTERKLKLLLAYRPDSATLHFALGNLYAEQSRWGEANQAYSNAYKRNPDDAQFAYNLAVSLDHLGQGSSAITYYQRVLQLDLSVTSSISHAQVQQRLNDLTSP